MTETIATIEALVRSGVVLGGVAVGAIAITTLVSRLWSPVAKLRDQVAEHQRQLGHPTPIAEVREHVSSHHRILAAPDPGGRTLTQRVEALECTASAQTALLREIHAAVVAPREEVSGAHRPVTPSDR